MGGCWLLNKFPKPAITYLFHIPQARINPTLSQLWAKKCNPLFLEIMIGMNLTDLPLALPLGNYFLHHKMPCILNHFFLSPILLCFQCKYFLSSRAQPFQVPPIPYSFMYFSLSLHLYPQCSCPYSHSFLWSFYFFLDTYTYSILSY